MVLLSIGLMVKDESKHLDQCLTSLVPVLEQVNSELIIVDTGSTDNTVDIARKYTDKVYYHEWSDDFSAMRNTVLSYTKGKWFFYLDGDEVVEDPSGIIRFFNTKAYKKFNAAFIELKNPYSSTDFENYGVFQALRFFVNDRDFCFKGIVHEQPQAKGPVAKIDGQIIHFGYVSDDKELMEYKYQRNVALINKVLEKDPDNIYHLFQLSQSYSMYGKNKQALEVVEKAYKLAKTQNLGSYMNVINQLAHLRFRSGLFIECEEVCREGLGLRDGYMDLYFFQAMSQVETGKYGEAISNFQQFLSLVDDYESGKGVIDLTLAHLTVRNRDQANLMLCALHNRIGDYESAIEYGKKVENPRVALDVTRHLVDIYFRIDDKEALKELYDAWQHDENVLTAIETYIENKRVGLSPEERRELSSLFADDDTPYGFLNTIREFVYTPGSEINDQTLKDIADQDLRRCESYYGDLLYPFIVRREGLYEVLGQLQSNTITRFFRYLLSSHEGLLDVLMNLMTYEEFSLNESFSESFETLRARSSMLHAILQEDSKLSDDDYRRIFQMYIEIGIGCVEACYNPRVLESEGTSWARTSSDGFLLVMRRAQKLAKNSLDYVRCLREALVEDERMKRGIELLVKEVQGQLKRDENELESLKKTVMQRISESINAGEIETAVAFISEYEKTVGVDAPLCSAKGIIHMIDGRLEEARNTFLLGLQLEPNNEDLLFNLRYLNGMNLTD